jgi:hypothetical protein
MTIMRRTAWQQGVEAMLEEHHEALEMRMNQANTAAVIAITIC